MKYKTFSCSILCTGEAVEAAAAVECVFTADAIVIVAVAAAVALPAGKKDEPEPRRVSE